MEHCFGEKLRTVRQRKGLTLKDVAGRAGVSESLVSQIERDKVSPAIDTLLKLAEVLEIDLDYLFRDLKRERAVKVVRSGERRTIEHKHIHYEQLALTEDQEHGIEAYLIEIAPGADRGSDAYGHPGKELGVIVEGAGEFEIGTQVYRLEAGDSIAFASDLPHVLRNSGEVPLKAFWVVTPPKGLE